MASVPPYSRLQPPPLPASGPRSHLDRGAVRPVLGAAMSTAWERTRRPGTWLTGSQRTAVAAETRASPTAFHGFNLVADATGCQVSAEKARDRAAVHAVLGLEQRGG